MRLSTVFVVALSAFTTVTSAPLEQSRPQPEPVAAQIDERTLPLFKDHIFKDGKWWPLPTHKPIFPLPTHKPVWPFPIPTHKPVWPLPTHKPGWPLPTHSVPHYPHYPWKRAMPTAVADVLDA